MSNDQKKTAPPSLTALDKLESIPVALLKFREHDAVELPYVGGPSSVHGVPAAAMFDETGKRAILGKVAVIDFFPAIRHHRVICYSGNQNEAPQERWVHEIHVRNWAPLR